MKILISLLLVFSVTASCGGGGGVESGGGQARSENVSYIDTHMHLDGSPTGASREGRTDLTGNYALAASNLIGQMDGTGVSKALIVSVPSQMDQTAEEDEDYIKEAIASHSDRLYYMAGGSVLSEALQGAESGAVTDAIKAAFEADAEAALGGGAKGFGEMISFHLCFGVTHSYQVSLADHPLFLALADVAARKNVPIDIHMEAVQNGMATPANLLTACDQNPSTLPATIGPLETLLAHNRGARIVWQHIGWDNIGQMTVDLLRSLLSKHSNLYMALRVEDRPYQVGGSTELMPNRIVDGNGTVKSEWLSLFEEFPTRFMIGADEFVGAAGSGTKGAPSFENTWAIIDQLPSSVASKIAGENAALVYGL